MTKDAGPRATELKFPPAAIAVANALREEIIERRHENFFLGSEEDLVQRLGVSRPTLRQAVRLLEYEDLVTVRRGIYGGFFSQKPSGDAVTHAASVWLRYQGSSLQAVMDARTIIEPACARLAAGHPDRSRTQDLLRSVEREGRELTAGRPASKAFTRCTADFHREIGSLSGSEPLELFVTVLLDTTFVDAPAPVVLDDPVKAEAVHSVHVDIAQAIHRGDADHADMSMKRHIAEEAEWFRDAIEALK